MGFYCNVAYLIWCNVHQSFTFICNSCSGHHMCDYQSMAVLNWNTSMIERDKNSQGTRNGQDVGTGCLRLSCYCDFDGLMTLHTISNKDLRTCFGHLSWEGPEFCSYLKPAHSRGLIGLLTEPLWKINLSYKTTWFCFNCSAGDLWL